MKKLTLFLVILIFFVPLVLSGQIDTIHTVGGWKITQHTGNVTKAGSRIVTDTTVYGNHSQSFFATQKSGSWVTFEKRYSTTMENIPTFTGGQISVYTKKMDKNGYVDVFISFGNDDGYSNPTAGLFVVGYDQGYFYPFTFSNSEIPPRFNKVRLTFISHGTNEFEIFLDCLFLSKYGNIDLLVDDFEDTMVPVRDELTLPNSFKLFQNYPNPFNPTTSIKYTASTIQYVNLTVYDVLGREIKTLVNEEKNPGEYEVKFNASHLPSGTYFYRLSVGNYTETKKMLLIK